MPDEHNGTAHENDPEQLIPLSKAAELSGFTQSHLRLLARQGKLWAKKLGRDWLTTEAAVKRYLSTERKPGPKSKDD